MAIASIACGGSMAMPSPSPSPSAETAEATATADALGFASCDRRPAEAQCTELASECPPEQRGIAADFETTCRERGFRYADGPCPRDGAQSFGESGPACLLVRLWTYAP